MADVQVQLPKKVWYAPNMKESYDQEEIQAVKDCLEAGWLAPGPRTQEFEEAVSRIFGKTCGVMVNSGSSANLIGLAVLELPAGSEVITPACTFSTTVAPIVQLGLTPVFVDVMIDYYVPSVEAVLAAITEKTKVIFVPDLIGSRMDWKALREGVKLAGRSDIVLFQDSCDTMIDSPHSDISVASFYASHVVTAGGCGGMVMFNDPKLQARALMFRDWGRLGNNSEALDDRFTETVDGIPYDIKFLYGVLGYNMKCCEMNAAFGLVQLRKLPGFLLKRRGHILRYVATLREAKTSYILPAKHEDNHWLALPLQHPGRAEILKMLEDNQVQTRVLFSGNITRHPAYRKYYTVFPVADEIMKNGFLLGAHHGMESADVDRVCDLLISFDRNYMPAVTSTLADNSAVYSSGTDY